ncbi:MAG TPA: DUF1592 domain-containing protein [bacterium]|nr:DUF1592 domain-containing protein [bacterium]
MPRRRSSAFCTAFAVAAGLFALAAAPPVLQAQADPPPTSDYRRQIRPLFAKYCFHCHGADRQKGDLRLDTLDPAMTTRAAAEDYAAVLDMLHAGDMPPEDEARPTDAERRLLLRWLTDSLRSAADRQRSERQVVLRRLTREQYSNSLRELLSLPIDFARSLPADGKARNGFSNNGAVLQATPLHLDNYVKIARWALDRALVLDRPQVAHYRVTFGKGIGKGRVAGRTGGYQSVPLRTDDFQVEILENGRVVTGGNEAERRQRERIQRKISVGLRGSAHDRFRIVDEGMILLSALPHREVAPKSWQGPSPNLKLEMQRVWPEQGEFVMRVVASRGYVPPMRRQMLVGLDEGMPAMARLHDGRLATAHGAIVLPAARSDQRRNLRAEGNALLPVAVPEPARARLRFTLPADGFYQVDLVHAPKAADQMPSIRLICAGHHLDQRPTFDEQQLREPAVVTPLGVIGMLEGPHHLEVGGTFFVGFTHVVITQLDAEHELVRRLTSQRERQNAQVRHLTPVLRALIGTRTDDGMDYTTFGEPVEVTAPLGQPRTFEFRGRLENMPIPAPESGDKEILSGFLLLGVWNDHLVKSADATGPPLLVRSIEFEAPHFEQWPPQSHAAIFPPRPEGLAFTSDDDRETYTRAVLERFVARAFRRPARADEVERYLGFWRDLADDYDRYEDAVREVLVAILCSPEFLFLCEPDDELGDDGALTDYMLANRLSYFLWNGPPDDELRELAAEGRLGAELLAQTERLLDDPKSARFLRNFTHEWLRMDRHENMAINVDVHPDYTRFVRRDMQAEVHAFVQHVFANDLPVETFVAADFAMLNQNLAEFYGIAGVTGPQFRRVAIGPEHPERRAGILSHGTFLAGHSDGTEPHPIKRAAWLRARVLGEPPPPPPPNVPELDPKAPGADRMTLKQRIEAHRDRDSCRDCHAGLDPYGFVFERLSAVGRFEPRRRGIAVDATAELPDGTRVDGLEGIRTWLVEHRRDQLARALLEHLFAYALGREVQFADDAELAALMEQIRAAGYRTRAVIRAIVGSHSFRSK